MRSLSRKLDISQAQSHLPQGNAHNHKRMAFSKGFGPPFRDLHPYLVTSFVIRPAPIRVFHRISRRRAIREHYVFSHINTHAREISRLAFTGGPSPGPPPNGKTIGLKISPRASFCCVRSKINVPGRAQPEKQTAKLFAPEALCYVSKGPKGPLRNYTRKELRSFLLVAAQLQHG